MGSNNSYVKKQFILAGAGIIAITLLFFFGRTTEKKLPITNVESVLNTQTFDIQRFIESSKQNLTPAQVLIVTKLENGISRGDVPAQQLQAYNSLANFWKDTAKLFEPYLFYVSKAAKLDNSEKSLTFAAQIFLEALRGEQDNSKLDWETSEAISLFENAIKLNPENDDLRIGLGSCYIYGKGRSGNPEQTMKGIQELLGVARRDSTEYESTGGFRCWRACFRSV